jgi:hypothetical protein
MQNEALIWLQKPTHVSENTFEKHCTYQRMGGEDFVGFMESAQKVHKLDFKQPSCEIYFYKRLLYGQLVCYLYYNIAHTAYSIEKAFWILCLKSVSVVLAYSCPKHSSMAHHIRCMVHL